MIDDPIVKAIHLIRERMAAECHHDVSTFVKRLQRAQRARKGHPLQRVEDSRKQQASEQAAAANRR